MGAGKWIKEAHVAKKPRKRKPRQNKTARKHKTADERTKLVKEAKRLMIHAEMKTPAVADKLGIPIAWIYYNVGSRREVLKAHFADKPPVTDLRRFNPGSRRKAA